MTMQKALHLTDDIDRLYVSRNAGRRKFASFEDCVHAPILGLAECIKIIQILDKMKETWLILTVHQPVKSYFMPSDKEFRSFHIYA